MAQPDNEPQPLTLVVRRGALRRYAALTKQTADLPVTVSWDQRVKERRGSPEPVESDHRTTERRSPPSFTWELADFVVVDPNPRSTSKP